MSEVRFGHRNKKMKFIKFCNDCRWHLHLLEQAKKNKESCDEDKYHVCRHPIFDRTSIVTGKDLRRYLPCRHTCGEVRQKNCECRIEAKLFEPREESGFIPYQKFKFSNLNFLDFPKDFGEILEKPCQNPDMKNSEV